METMITVAKNSNNAEFIKYAHSLGVRLFRFNMDYKEQALSAIHNVRAQKYDDALLFADFQGVKMRLRLKPEENNIEVHTGDNLTISTTPDSFPYITNFNTIREYIEEGQNIGFSDGKVSGIITKVDESEITIQLTQVNYVLRQNAGVSITGNGIPAPHMTTEACSLIANSEIIRRQLIDWVILSFTDSAEEIRDFANTMHKKGIKVMAKIETPNGVKHIADIAKVVDGFMLGRGDLTSTSGEQYKKLYHDALISMSKTENLFNGVGTFFLSHYSKTREVMDYEIKDVEEVKLYGFDYIMLSKEVVNSNYPNETLKLLQKICKK